MTTPDKKPEPDTHGGGTVWDYPNTQVVHADESAPWDEGTGGTPGTVTVEADEADTNEAPSLDAMTKAQLHARADDLGIEVESGATKDDIRTAIEQSGG